MQEEAESGFYIISTENISLHVKGFTGDPEKWQKTIFQDSLFVCDNF